MSVLQSYAKIITAHPPQHNISIGGTNAASHSQDLQLDLPIQAWTANATKDLGIALFRIADYEATGATHDGTVFVSSDPDDDVRWNLTFHKRNGRTVFTIAPSYNTSIGWTVVNEHNFDPFIALREFSKDYHGQLFLFEWEFEF